MSATLLSEIETFLAETGMSEYRFGYRAVKNGRLVNRLRDGRRVWPETVDAVRGFMAAERELRGRPAYRSRPCKGRRPKPRQAVGTADAEPKAGAA